MFTVFASTVCFRDKEVLVEKFAWLYNTVTLTETTAFFVNGYVERRMFTDIARRKFLIPVP